MRSQNHWNPQLKLEIEASPDYIQACHNDLQYVQEVVSLFTQRYTNSKWTRLVGHTA